MRAVARAGLRALAVIVVMTMLAASTAHGDDPPLAGSQGTDTSLPATDSQMTVHGRDGFSDLAITVNQTKSLNNQAVSITWTGGIPTVRGHTRFESQYMQIMQCWGDDDGTIPENPGPPPEQCEQGAVSGTPSPLQGELYPESLAMTRIISRSDWPNFTPSVGNLDTRTTNVWLPFRAVDGTTIDIQIDPTFRSDSAGKFWLNTFYNNVTTNEVVGAATDREGRGSELFQVLTGVESSGLGCGQRTQPTSAGAVIPKCWIVIVPRGASADENAGTGFEGDTSVGVSSSPLSPAVWKHRIAIPIEFNPVDSPCTLGADERRISGSELALTAVTSWQPALCGDGSLPPFSYAPVSDSSARQQLLSHQPGAPGMAIVSRPIPPASVNPADPVLYAPISLSGIVIGFNIERNTIDDAPADEKELGGVRVAELNLTPRLVAKLLTQSYVSAVKVGGGNPNYPWTASNPLHMGLDPDFMAWNPEFTLLKLQDFRTFSGLQLPAGSSDAAQQVWEWILADPEARAWLDGQPDEWGMRVNPVYATVAAANSTGVAFGQPIPTSYPKADPYCYQAPTVVGRFGPVIPPLMCGTDWMPYKASYSETALVTRMAADGARVAQILDPPLAAADFWKRETPQGLGVRGMIALTDSPSAARFGLQTARLSRAGDDASNRTFVAADSAGLAAGVAGMGAAAEPQVLEPDPALSAPGGYPLTMLTYAAIAPLGLDDQARADYSAFLKYAAISGQVPGFELGKLPRGYASLPVDLQAQTLLDAVLVEALVLVPDEPEPTTTTTAPATTTTTTTAPATTTTAAPTSTAAPTTQAPVAPVEEETTPAAPPTTARRPTSPASPTPTFSAPVTTAPVGVAAPVITDVTETTGAPETTAPPATTVAPTTTAAPTTTVPPNVVTKALKIAKSRFAVPGLGVVAIGSALGALEISKRPRRRRGPVVDVEQRPDDDALTDDLGEV